MYIKPIYVILIYALLQLECFLVLGVIVTFPFLSECAEILDALGCVIDFRVSVPKAGLGLDLYTNPLFEYK